MRKLFGSGEKDVLAEDGEGIISSSSTLRDLIAYLLQSSANKYFYLTKALILKKINK